MRILLIKPNLLREQDKQGHLSSLLTGLLAIASHVKDRNNLRIAVYPDDKRYIKESLSWCDAVGIGASTFEYETARRIISSVKESFPNKLYFIGGNHVTLLNHYDRQLFDFMISGEGEKIVRSLVEDEIDVMPNESYRCLRAPDLLREKEMPLIDYTYYPAWKRLKGQRISLITSRGCQYTQCRFCTSRRFNKRLRRMPVDQVTEQIEKLVLDLESNKFNIWDDNFSDDVSRLRSIALQLRERNVKLQETSVFCRTSSTIADEVFSLLNDLGVMTLVTGFESGSNRMLQYLKGPGASVEHHHVNCLKAKARDMEVLGSVMFGSPTETIDEMCQTIDLIQWKLESKIRGAVWIYVATPLPGSDFWDIAAKRKRVHPDMDFDTLSFENYDSPLLMEEYVPTEEFNDIIAKALSLGKSFDQIA